MRADALRGSWPVADRRRSSAKVEGDEVAALGGEVVVGAFALVSSGDVAVDGAAFGLE